MPPRQQYVQCDSLRTLECELDSLRDKLAISESEETWDTIAKAILRFTLLLQNGALNFPHEVVNGLRSVARPLNSAILSERSRLSGAAIDLLKAAGEGLGKTFDGLIPLYIPTLLTLCSRSNKVFITRAKACMINIIEATQAPTILSYLAEAAKDKSLSLRLSAAEGGLACLNSFNPPDLEKEARAREVEALIKATATDPSADIRKVSRKLFEAYKILLPHRVDNFTAPLTPIAKKYLDIRSRAPSASTSNPPSRPTSSQSTHSLNAVSRPKPTITKSSTTLFPTASGSNVPDGLMRTRTISSTSGPSLTRSESAPSTSQSTSAVTSNAAPLRPPVVGPSRPRPAPAPAAVQRGPTRPTISRDMPPPATIPIRPQPVPATMRPTSESPEPNPFALPESKSNPLKNSGGPMRPNGGPSRVPQEAGEQKQRVVGGARRVLLPEPAPQPVPPAPAPVAEVRKATTPPAGHSRTPSNASVDQVPPSKPPTKPEVSTRAPVTAPVAKPDVKKIDPSKTKARSNAPPANAKASSGTRRAADPSMSTSTVNTTTHRTTNTTMTTTSRRTGTTSSRLTEPTQSQLARAKSTKPMPTKKNEVAKPIGNKPVPTKAAPPPKGGMVTTRRRVVSTAPKLAAPSAPPPEVAAAAAVPLPKSPSPGPSPLPVQPMSRDKRKASPAPVSPSPSPSVSPTREDNESISSTGDQEHDTTIMQQQPAADLPQILEPEADSDPQSPAPPSPAAAVIQIDPATPDPSTPRPTFPAFQTVPETPISSLLESIQRGFDFSPAPPFDPDQTCTYGGMLSPEELRCDPLAVGERRPLHPIS
ncbi:hypothetical protein EIP91_002194 [Steccherinum ochraceum]|uniref:CLASP N-terminal domain-containing protein n=1 Tax=Steccherinum ochraceum TaxID=92696 RepID=A0A4R0RCP6_9APHY|nr:hypothetical protein EIP91_002194 [Steccherinum ochraceum]